MTALYKRLSFPIKSVHTGPPRTLFVIVVTPHVIQQLSSTLIMAPPTEEATVAAVALKLPPFTLKSPQVWFQRAEVKFRLAKITDNVTKADHVLNSMTEPTIERITGWLSRQDANLDYNTLKEYIIKRFSLPPAERAQHLLNMASIPIGDLTATECWDEIETLATRPDKVSLEREILLQRLPDAVRRALPDAHELPISELLTKADQLLSTHRTTNQRAAARSQISQVYEDDDDEDTYAADDETRVNAIREKKNARRPSNNKGKLCFYHEKFGTAAKKCLPGCIFSPKNGSAGRQ